MATAKKAPVKKAAMKMPKTEETVTLDQLIEGAKENIEFQMKQPHFSRLPRNAHAMAARDSLKQTIRTTKVDTEGMNPDELHKYLTSELEITDKK